MILSNKVYNILKWIAQVFLPAFIALWGVIGTTCNIPYTEQALTIMGAVDTFIGALLVKSSQKYFAENEK